VPIALLLHAASCRNEAPIHPVQLPTCSPAPCATLDVDLGLPGQHDFKLATSDGARVTALLDAASELEPSDGVHECYPIADYYPRVDIQVNDGRRQLSMSSRSGCWYFGPWNVVRDGSLFVQYRGGAIWNAISPMLVDAGAELSGVAIDHGSTSALVSETLPSSPSVATAPSTRERFTKLLSRAPLVRDLFGRHPKFIEPVISCEMTSRCATWHSSVVAEFAPGVQVRFDATATHERVLAVGLEDDTRRVVRSALENRLVRAVTAVRDTPRVFHFTSEPHCPTRDGVAPHACRRVRISAVRYIPEWSAEPWTMDLFPDDDLAIVYKVTSGRSLIPELSALGNDVAAVRRAIDADGALFTSDGKLLWPLRSARRCASDSVFDCEDVWERTDCVSTSDGRGSGSDVAIGFSSLSTATPECTR